MHLPGQPPRRCRSPQASESVVQVATAAAVTATGRTPYCSRVGVASSRFRAVMGPVIAGERPARAVVMSAAVRALGNVVVERFEVQGGVGVLVRDLHKQRCLLEPRLQAMHRVAALLGWCTTLWARLCLNAHIRPFLHASQMQIHPQYWIRPT